MAEEIKVCVKCGLLKKLDEFERDKRRRDGRAGVCQACTTARLAGWRAAHPGSHARISARWRAVNLEKDRAAHAARRDWFRVQVFGHYGWVCACCGSAENLTIDHVNGDGSRHREELFGNGKQAGWKFYRWLVKNGFPGGYQTLCVPCNASKNDGDRCRIGHAVLQS